MTLYVSMTDGGGMMVSRKKRTKKVFWFKSGIFVLFVAFIIINVTMVWKFGWSGTLDNMLKYGGGMTATALFIALLAYIFRKPIKNWLRR